MNTVLRQGLVAYRASIFHLLRDPGTQTDEAAIEFFDDGVLLVENGRIAKVGPAESLLKELPADINLVDYSGKLIIPGMIDAHIHYPQTDMIASYGEQLLEWLNKYTFPTEGKFADQDYANDVADFFINELLRNGTTTALVLATVHPGSVDAIFEASQAKNMRMLAGKVMMDRNAPEYLLDTPQSSYRDSKMLLEKWHNVDRLLYAITPRFAPTSSDAQLQQVANLAKEHPDAYVHTHVAENKKEVQWVSELFPWSRSYLDVYDHFDLLRERSVYAHCIHLDQQDRKRMADTGATAAFCPTSNTFLGSGLFNCLKVREQNINVAIATDVGAGTSFSMLQTLSEAYKVQQLNDYKLSPFRALFLATLGNAQALYLEDKIGNFLPGKEADFVVLDDQATPLIKRRMAATQNIEEKIFVYVMLGDDRVVNATYIMGECTYNRD